MKTDYCDYPPSVAADVEIGLLSIHSLSRNLLRSAENQDVIRVVRADRSRMYGKAGWISTASGSERSLT